MLLVQQGFLFVIRNIMIEKCSFRLVRLIFVDASGRIFLLMYQGASFCWRIPGHIFFWTHRAHLFVDAYQGVSFCWRIPGRTFLLLADINAPIKSTIVVGVVLITSNILVITSRLYQKTTPCFEKLLNCRFRSYCVLFFYFIFSWSCL